MNKLRVFSKRRLFVLVGSSSVTTFLGVADFRGRWKLTDWTSATVSGELRADALAQILTGFCRSRGLIGRHEVHWFLPPDMLAVAFLAKSADRDNLVLPFSDEHVLSKQVHSCDAGQIWLWIHRNWCSLLARAAEQANCESLYVHPRQALLQRLPSEALDASHSASAPWRVVHDGSNRHVYLHALMLRSFVVPDAHDAIRLQLELDALHAAWGATQNCTVKVLTRDLERELSRPPSPGEVFDPGSTFTSSSLHDWGVLTGSLTGVAERVVWRTVAAVAACLLVAVIALTMRYQRAVDLNAQASLESKRLAPGVRQLSEVRQTLEEQKGVLQVAERLGDAPQALVSMGALIDALPSRMTLQSLRVDSDTLEIRVAVVGGEGVPSDWPPKIPNFEVLTVVGDDPTTANGAVLRSYRSKFTRASP